MKLLFMGTPATPPRNDTFPRQVNDRSTNLRLEVWARLSVALARQEGWDVVDLFHYSAPFTRETPDLAHYLMTDALDPMLDAVLGVLGVCDAIET